MKKILLVDDDPELLKMLKIALEGEERKFDVARHRQGAEMYLKKECYDLVIMDIFLPDTRALELVDFAKGMDLDYPIILMSGYLEPDDNVADKEDIMTEEDFRMEAERKGVYATLHKPLDLERLRSLTREILDD